MGMDAVEPPAMEQPGCEHAVIRPTQEHVGPPKGDRVMRMIVSFATLLIVLLAGCASSPPAPVSDRDTLQRAERSSPAVSHAVSGQKILRTAEYHIGTPNRYGGSHPDRGFDCGGLVAWSHGRHGIEVPRTAHAQSRKTSPVDLSHLAEGDLVFFRFGGQRVSHVGIHAGDGRFLHAPKNGGHVFPTRPLDDRNWQRHLAGVGRFAGRD